MLRDWHAYDPKTGKEIDMEHTKEEKQHFKRSMSKLHWGALHRHFGIPRMNRFR